VYGSGLSWASVSQSIIRSGRQIASDRQRRIVRGAPRSVSGYTRPGPASAICSSIEARLSSLVSAHAVDAVTSR
jgi:hypothetical protein